jgi:hypothetical protein
MSTATTAPASPVTEAPARHPEDDEQPQRPEQADLVIEPIEGRPLWQDSTWSQEQDDKAVALLEHVMSGKEAPAN